jgi:hypothetical protein
MFLIRIIEYVAASGKLYSLAGSIRISILCTGGADVHTSCGFELVSNEISN